MGIVIPALMTQAAGEGEELYRETSTRLLALAAINQAGFRATVGALNSGQRAFLEEVIRSGQQSGSEADAASAGEPGQPSITLKLNFGG
jgi:hypothetical protein